MTKPNLFDFATSELSQDAFIAWLLAWADPRYAQADVSLHGTAVRLLERLLDLCSIPRPDAIRKVEVKRQYKKIDVLVELNDQIAIGIEDKVHTQEHSGQLQRYRCILSERFRENVAAVYLKTGDQCDYSGVGDARFKCFGREDFIRSLKVGRNELGVHNHIYDDFLDHLERWEESVNAFKTKTLENWSKDQWVGFYKDIQTKLDGCDWWGYVPNQSGGFMGLSWHWRDGRYLQLEEKRLCFKMRANDADTTDLRKRCNEWASALRANAKTGPYRFRNQHAGAGERL